MKKLNVMILSIVSVVILILVSIITSYTFFRFYSSTLNNIETNLIANVEHEADYIYGEIFSKSEKITEDYASVINNFNNYDSVFLGNITTNLIASEKTIVGGGYWLEYNLFKNKKFYGPYWYKEGESIKLTWDYSKEENDYTKFDWYINDGLKDGKKIVWSKPYNDAVTNVPMITATSALVKDGKKAGVVTFDLGLKELTDYVSTIKLKGLKDYSFSLINNEGAYLAAKDNNLIGKNIKDVKKIIVKEASFDSGSSLTNLQNILIENKNIFIAYTPINSTGLILVLEADRDSILKPVNNTLLFNILFTIFLLTASIIIVSYTINKILTNPLNMIKNKLTEVSNGIINTSLDVKSQDEVGQIAMQFNILTANLNRLIKQIKEVQNAQQSISVNLTGTAGDSFESIELINTNFKSLKDKINILDSDINNINNTIKDLNGEIFTMSQKVASQSAEVDESSASIEEMTTSLENIGSTIDHKIVIVDNLQKIAKSGESEMKSTIDIINNINSSAAVIIEIVKVIDNIASQTNLLAMNAAIEASHAGQYGKGFSVVADEIRKLAINTQSNSNTINKSLKQIVEYIDISGNSAKKTGAYFNDIVKEVNEVSKSMYEIKASMEEINTGSSQIVKTLNHLVGRTDEINMITKNLKDETGFIDSSIAEISEISKAANSGINEIYNSAKGISDSVNKVLENANNNSAISENMKSLVNTFRTE